jgi:hypothetical protein
MPAAIRFKDTDGTTVITTVNLSRIDSPGSSSNKLVYADNEGDQSAENVVVTLEQVGNNDGYLYALEAADSGGSPGVFGTSSVSLGTILAGQKKAFWFKATLPSGVTADNNDRIFNMLADYDTI